MRALVVLKEDHFMELAEALTAITNNPMFETLSEERKKRLEATWVQFVTTRTTLDQPDWGTLVTTLMIALPDTEAKVFAETLEKFS